MISKEFWQNKTVLITGHTGFKGSWLSLLLHSLGSDVHGYALDPPTIPSLFEEARISELITSHTGDIRDYNKLVQVLQAINPDIVIHMAAQPLVRYSYEHPVETYEVNVMGTINLLEAVRNTRRIKAVLNVTTDKCYENKEWLWGYRENDALGGYDPYSNSKACSEFVTSAFRNSFLNTKDYEKHGVAIATARAGNVIGGGDWAEDRLIPDFIRSITFSNEVKIRSPYSIRPWQHVLEPLTGYMMLAERLYTDGPMFAEAWNFGPDDTDARNVDWITAKFSELWGAGFSYSIDKNPQHHEATYLKLDCSKAKAELGWTPKLDIEKALTSTVDWYKTWFRKEDVRKLCLHQMEEYFNSKTGPNL
jgi:CDP-glucose 4,6-dehydratase